MNPRLSLAGFAGWLLAAVAACAGSAQWTGDQLALTAGDYRVEFRADCARTIGRILYRENAIVNTTGANQAVINVKGEENPREWIGTCHGGEEMETFDLYVDGKRAEANVTVEGAVFKVVKKSRLGPIAYHSEVEISDQGIHEIASFERTAWQPEINVMYPFMHCWSKDFTRWFAITDGAVEQDRFYGDNRYLLNKDVLAVALFDEQRKIGVCYCYPEIYRSKGKMKDKANRFWSRPIDNKLYFRADTPENVGEKIRYECRITAFDADGENWKGKARAFIGKRENP